MPNKHIILKIPPFFRQCYSQETHKRAVNVGSRTNTKSDSTFWLMLIAVESLTRQKGNRWRAMPKIGSLLPNSNLCRKNNHLLYLKSFENTSYRLGR